VKDPPEGPPIYGLGLKWNGEKTQQIAGLHPDVITDQRPAFRLREEFA